LETDHESRPDEFKHQTFAALLEALPPTVAFKKIFRTSGIKPCDVRLCHSPRAVCREYRVTLLDRAAHGFQLLDRVEDIKAPKRPQQNAAGLIGSWPLTWRWIA
jgi:hypothetical protein